MSDFENQLAAQALKGINVPEGTSDFQILVTEAQYPVGTVMRRGTTIPIDYKACAPSQAPDQYPLPSQFPSYNLSSNVASSFGLDDTVISQLAGAGVKLNGARTVTVTITDPKIEVIADHDLTSLVATAVCAAAIEDQVVWYVRGYIIAKRTFLTSLATGVDANAKVMKIGNFDVSGNGQGSVGITDSTPVGFLEVISQISPPPAVIAPSPPPPSHSHLARPLSEAILPPPKISVPSSGPARGQIYVQKDRADTSGDDAEIVAALRKDGLPVVSIVQKIDSSKMPSVAQIRYFNAADAASANVALTSLKAFYPGAKLVQFKLPAPPGQFEVWLPRVG